TGPGRHLTRRDRPVEQGSYPMRASLHARSSSRTTCDGATRIPGGMRERPNRHAWKACEGQPSVGSNPTPSAMSVPVPLSDDGISELDAMQRALAEAHEALRHDDVPVGAVVVHRGAVI